MAEEKQPINTRVQIYTTNEPLEAKNVTYKGLICVNKASLDTHYILILELVLNLFVAQSTDV